MTSGTAVTVLNGTITTARNGEPVARWQGAADALAAAQTADEAIEAVLTRVAPAIGARGAWVALAGTMSGDVLCIASAHDGFLTFTDFCRAAADPLAEATRTGEAIVLATATEWGRYSDAGTAANGARNASAYAALPLTVGGVTFGALGLAFDAPKGLADVEGSGFLGFVAGACALALDRVGGADRAARATAAESTSALRQRAFLRDVLGAVTAGRLNLCLDHEDLPDPLPEPTHPEQMLSSGGLGRLRTAALQAAVRCGLPRERAMDLVIAAGEAGMNAIVHAGGGTAQVFADPGRGVVQVWIADHGQGIGDYDLPRATLERGFTTAGSLGCGFPMMLQTVDRVHLLTRAGGTVIVLEQGRSESPALTDGLAPFWK
jgi:anti-sigma regulatory factor (Ser/Thr protein kinase)